MKPKQPLVVMAGPPDVGNAATPETSVVRVRALIKRFQREDGSPVPAIDNVALDVEPGEFVVLLGPSGCGKTTLLRGVAGLEKPDQGTIDLYGRRVFDAQGGVNVPPEKRHISMVFQSYALWPHLSVFDNVAYPLRSRNTAGHEITPRVHEALALVGISELVRQYPTQMSGGQQQRVALARAIVSRDNLVLFDEPLSNVDAKVREQLRIELLAMQRKLGFAALYVTHDQTEAMALAHRVAVMRAGKVVQFGSPRDIYERPNSRYVADFVGTSNELLGRISCPEGADRVRVSTALGDVVATPADASMPAGKAVAIVFRPECCVLSASEPSSPNRWKAEVGAALFLGSHVQYMVRVGERSFQVWTSGAESWPPGATTWLSVPPAKLRAVPIEE